MYRVVLADDERIALKTLQKMLTALEVPLEIVGTAQNGIELLERIRQEKPHLVITDICMPGMDGLQVIGQTLEDGLQIKYILTSAYTDFEYARRAIRLGVEDFIPKPVRKTEFVETVNYVLSKMDEGQQETKTYSRMIKSAKEYIEKNYQKHLTLEEVAAQVYVSPNYLSALFHKEMGIHFLEYVTNIRLSHAKDMMDELNYSISDIAGLVGYKDAGHFNQVFAKKYGVSPAKYRKMGIQV